MYLKPIIDYYKITIKSERENDYDCLCPFHEDTYTSFSIEKNTGVWLCRAGCGKGNILNLIAKLENNDYSKAREVLKSFFSDVSSIKKRINNLLNPIKNEILMNKTLLEVDLPKEFIPFSSVEKKDINFPYFDYILSRLSFKTIKDFNIGYCDSGFYKNRIIIPIVINKINVGFIARSIYNDRQRYLNPKGVQFSKLIFGLDQTINNDVFLCESTFDALTLYSWGYKTPLATFGANITYSQISYLLDKKIKNLFLCFHNDKAGFNGMFDKINFLRSLFNVKYLILPKDQDINEMNKEDFDYIFTNAQDLEDKTKILRHIRNKL